MASDVPNNGPVLISIKKHLHELRKKQNLILRNRNQEPVYKKHNLIFQNKRRKLCRSKNRVAAKIDMLEKLFEEFSSKSRGPLEKESVGGLFKADLRSRMNEDETKEPRYLCVSNGCVICCLDLKEGQGQSLTNARDIPPLPKITTLKLMEERLPVSVGLFKSGSHAYMIGGQHFPPSVVNPENYRDPLFIPDWGENPKGYYLYRTICSLHFLKGTSRVTYRLSLKDDATTLSPSQSNTIGKLNKPKFWPIVEKIKGQIHVFDSYPSRFDDDPNCDWIFSHEVLKQVSRHCSWIEIPTPDEEIFIRSHAVVGDRIYAVGGGKFSVFDSNTEKWKARPAVEWKLPLSAKKVWHILHLGIARCAGEFPYPFPLGGEAKASDRLYVLVAVMRDALNDGYGTSAVAYLVTSRGRVVCVQRLPRFFEKPVEPWLMVEGTIIDVDEDEDGKKMCCIVNGNALLNGKKVDNYWRDYLFINTFAVEMRTDVAAKIREIWAQGSKAWPVEQDFVRVDIDDKDRYIYKTDAKLKGEGDLPGFPGLQACFL